MKSSLIHSPAKHLYYEPIIWFIFTWFLYFVLGYPVAAYSRALPGSFDCILTLDCSIRFHAVIDPENRDRFLAAIHPFYTLIMRPLFYAFKALFSPDPVAMLAAQATVSSIGMVFFNLMLRRLSLLPLIRQLAMLLLGSCYTMLLFTIYTETYNVGAATLAVAYYIIIRRPENITKPFYSAGTAILVVAGNLINFMHFGVMLAVNFLKKISWNSFIKTTAAGVYGLAGILCFSFFLRFIGFNKNAMPEGLDYSRTTYGYLNALYKENLHSPLDLLDFAARSSVQLRTYAEMFSNLFYAPLTGTPLTGPSWSHGCVSLDFYTIRWSWILALGFLILGGIGVREAIKRNTYFLQTVVWALLANVIYYTFFYLRADSYFYSLSYMLLYVVLIALGAEHIYSLLSRHLHKQLWLLFFALMTCLAVGNSIYQIYALNIFALHKFSM